VPTSDLQEVKNTILKELQPKKSLKKKKKGKKNKVPSGKKNQGETQLRI
jgi:hypothetical protein